MLAVTLAWLLNNWKAAVAGLVFAAVLAYTGVVVVERNHYKSAYGDTKLKLDTLVKDSRNRLDALQADADAITKKYASANGDANTLAIEAARLTQEKIASDKELAATRLSLNAVRMFNASKPSAASEVPAAQAIGGDARKADPAPATATAEVSGFTMQDLLAQSARNDAAHLACIAQVEQWQQFWSDFTAAVAASGAQP